jgi:DNA-binding LacI/PurR family transcriptional regulator
MRVRLADIATRAGVSEATVSRVVNHKPGVSEENRKAILKTIEVLGYERPERVRPRHSGLVGLIVPELTNPIFPLIAQVVETALAARGFTSVLCTQTLGGVHEDEYVRMLLERNVSGIVFVSGIHANTDTDPARYASLRQRGLPIVLINGFLSGVDAPFLSNDDAFGAELAVRHLAALGHIRIGLATGPERYVPVQRKLAGFQAAYRAHVDRAATPEALAELVEFSVFTVDGGEETTDRLLDRGVTAVVCGSDVMAFGAIRAAHRRGLRVPADLSVVGSDGIPFGEFSEPPLTTVQQPAEEIAEAAARALLEEIAGNPATRAEYIFRPHLVVRASSGPARHAASERRSLTQLA